MNLEVHQLEAIFRTVKILQWISLFLLINIQSTNREFSQSRIVTSCRLVFVIALTGGYKDFVLQPYSDFPDAFFSLFPWVDMPSVDYSALKQVAASDFSPYRVGVPLALLAALVWVSRHAGILLNDLVNYPRDGSEQEINEFGHPQYQIRSMALSSCNLLWSNVILMVLLTLTNSPILIAIVGLFCIVNRKKVNINSLTLPLDIHSRSEYELLKTNVIFVGIPDTVLLQLRAYSSVEGGVNVMVPRGSSALQRALTSRTTQIILGLPNISISQGPYFSIQMPMIEDIEIGLSTESEQNHVVIPVAPLNNSGSVTMPNGETKEPINRLTTKDDLRSTIRKINIED